MDDPGLPPKPRSLNLLESLIMEEEIKAREANTRSRRTVTRSPEYYDPEKHVISRDVRGSSYSLFEMDDRLSCSQVVRCDPNAGFRGRKVTKPFASERHKTSKSAELNPSESILKNKTKLQRPFSADYNRNKMRRIQPNGRAKSARPSQDRHVQWLQGQRSRSPDSLVSDTCSSDEEKENDRESKQSNHGRYEDSGFLAVESEQRQNSDENANSSDTDSRLSGISSDEGKKRKKKHRKQKVAKGLSRQKKQKLRILQSDPQKFYGEKLQQKFSELKELMASPLTHQKSQMLQHHLQQIEQLHDQYKVASHGLLSPGPIIPRSLPEDIRHRSHQPTVPAAKNLLRRSTGANKISCERDHRVTVQSVEPITNTGRLKTDSHIDTPTTTATSEKKKKIVNAKLPNSHNDKEESETNNQQAATFMPHEQLSPASSKISTVDHHIKFSDNEYLRKWLKEKDKKYRRKLREDRKQKKEEKERLIMDANEKLERKIQSQKVVESWMKEKDKEMTVKYKEIYSKYKELDKNGVFSKGPNLPGNSMRVKPLDKSLNDSKVRDREQSTTHGYNKTRPSNSREIDIEHNGREVSESHEIIRPHPPQTKFLYKRPASGNISFNMHVRGTSPFSPRQSQTSMENDRPGNALTPRSSRSNRSSQGSQMKDKRNYSSSVKEREMPKLELFTNSTVSKCQIPVQFRAQMPRSAEMIDKAVHMVNADDDTHAAFEGDESAVAHQEDIPVDGIDERWSEIDIETSEDSTSTGSEEESVELSEFNSKAKTESEKKTQVTTVDSIDNTCLPQAQGNTTDNEFENVNGEKAMPFSKFDEAEMIKCLNVPLCADQDYEVLEEMPLLEEEVRAPARRRHLQMLDSNCVSSDLPERVELNDMKNGKEEGVNDVKEMYEAELIECSKEQLCEELDQKHEELKDLPLKEKVEVFVSDCKKDKRNDIKSEKEEGVLKEESGAQNDKSVRGQESDTDKQAGTASGIGLGYAQQTDSNDILENLGGLPLTNKFVLLAMEDDGDPIESIVEQEQIYEELKNLPLEEKIVKLMAKDQNRNPI